MNITLAITTFNRGALLRRSLERLEHLTHPTELIVVDDGGSDGTDGICREFEGRLPIRYIYNHNPRPSICSQARNIALRHARFDYFATSEPELMFRTDVLAQFSKLKLEYPGDLISAGTIFHTNDSAPPVDPELPEHELVQHSTKTLGWVAPYTALYRKDWLMSVGGWDESFPGPWGWDDTDVLTRLRCDGHGQHIALDVEAIHQFHGLGSDANRQNEEHFLAKSFHQDWDDRTHVVANKEREWGVLSPRD